MARTPVDAARPPVSALRRRGPDPHAIAVVAVGLALRLDLYDWGWIILAIALVWSAEALNTAIEQVYNRISPDTDPIIKAAKDVAAGAVLIAAVAAALIGTG